jgi:methyltransferase-like protein/ubiquinone/menaquinone biosynthesis C-methylase UbiE
MTRPTEAQTYDEEPYADLTHSQTHPGLLAAIGLLLGLNPAPVDGCRVLELGCGAGANLAAMAEVLPESEFVGVDYSERQVAEGTEAIRELALSNVRLVQADISAMETADLGVFDFIIAHGVYSWVPANVRERLLAICKLMLNPQGIVYISYNAYPGWFAMRPIRDAMLYRTRETTSLREKADQGEAFATLLRANAGSQGAYAEMLESYEAHTTGRHQIGGHRAASLLLHDELADINEPFYFHEFATAAAAHGLQYLADADFPSIFPTRLIPEAQAELRSLARDVIEHQQYIDFLSNASFRQTLLCHEERTLTRQIGRDRAALRRLFAGSPARLEASQPTPATAGMQHFVGGDGARLAIDSPVGKAAMLTLCERYPSRIAFPDLLSAALARLGANFPAQGNEEDQLAAVLLQGFCYSTNLVELGTLADRYTLAPGDTPHASAFARRRIAQGLTSVTNLRHARVTLNPFHASLVTLFDGTRSRDDVLAILERDLDSGAISVKDGEEVAETPQELLSTAVDRATEYLAEMALFLP